MLLWSTRSASNSDQPSIVSGDGMVYVAGGGQVYGDSGTYAFDATTGKRQWQAAGPYPYAAGPGAVFGFEVIASGVTDVVAVSAAAGLRLWTHDAGRMLDDAEVGWLAYADDMVFIAAGTTEDSVAGQTNVRALDVRTGDRVWAASIGVGPRTPALANGVVYVAEVGSLSAKSARLVALDATSGVRLWTSAEIDGNPYVLTAADGIVCCSVLTGKGETFGFDGSSGRRLWQTDVAAVPIASTEGIVFLMSAVIGQSASSASFTVWAVHTRSGEQVWKRTFPGEPAIAASEGVLCIGAGNGSLQAIAALTGRTMWSREMTAVAVDAAISGDVVFVLDERGTISAYKV
jgi:outer membrane protein assembly factor BamB